MERGERAQRLAHAHAKARVAAGKSQEYVAMELGVNRRTVQNWEKGISAPTLFQSLEYFRVVNANPFPAFLSCIYPQELHVTGQSSDEEIEAAFNAVIDNISINDKRALLYLYYGAHGSDPYSVMQLMLAHLHLPIKERVADAQGVLLRYQIEKELGNLICKDNIQPNIEDLMDAIDKAQAATLKREYGYVTEKKGRV